MANTPATAELKYPQMSFLQKLIWWGKFLIALASFGFAFPHIMEARLRRETYMGVPRNADTMQDTI